MTHPQVNDRVEVPVGDTTFEGTVRQVVTEESVRDPLTGDEFEPAEDDPVLLLDTLDGQMAAMASEVKRLASALPDDEGEVREDFEPLLELLATRAVERGAVEAKTGEPSGAAVREVYRRGLTSWPGREVTELAHTAWAVRRVEAFLDRAEGKVTPGYTRDDDLLPVVAPGTRT